MDKTFNIISISAIFLTSLTLHKEREILGSFKNLNDFFSKYVWAKQQQLKLYIFRGSGGGQKMRGLVLTNFLTQFLMYRSQFTNQKLRSGNGELGEPRGDGITSGI